MTARYLAVPAESLELVAHLEPVFGSKLIDGRVVAKVRGEVTELPEGVEDLGTDPELVRELLAPPEPWS